MVPKRILIIPILLFSVAAAIVIFIPRSHCEDKTVKQTILCVDGDEGKKCVLQFEDGGVSFQDPAKSGEEVEVCRKEKK